MKELEKRFQSVEVKAENGEKGDVIIGRPIVYDSRTDLGFFDEVIDRGALDGTDLRDVRFLVNHDLSKIPLARSRRNNGNSTMQLIPDEDGMRIEVQLDTENNADAKSLYSAISRGDITGMSFMFSVDEDSWEGLETEHPFRRIKKIGTVVEVSAVTFPAYESTWIETVSKEALDNARSALDRARQLNAETLDSGIELLKEKTKLL